MNSRKRDLLTGTAIFERGLYNHPGMTMTGNRPRFKVNPVTAGAPPPMSNAQKIQMADAAATQLILAQAQPMYQPMISTAYPGNNVVQGQNYNYNLINVGLNRRIVLEITGTIAQAAGETLTKTPFGIFNLISNVTLTDLSNYQRVNTMGRHLFALATARNRAAYGASFLNDSPAKMGSNMLVNNAPAEVVNVAQPFRFFIEIPLCYHERDLRGAVWANVTGGNWRVNLTFNQTPIVGSAAVDTSNACYQSSTAGDVGVISNVNVVVYQDYLTNIPTDPKSGKTILPTMSLAYNYLLLNTPNFGIVANTDFATQYTNFRTFLSTMFEYNNDGVLNPGTDIAYVAIQVANQLYIDKETPFSLGLKTRNLIGDDFPAGFYYFDHRKKPIITNNTGNTQLIINASSANAGAYLNVFWEMLSLQNQALNAATSLPAS